jgi:sugar transferase EpsL
MGIFLLVFFAFAAMGEWPLLFKQHRTGKHGKHFWLYKFRTLKVDSNLPISERQFTLGKWLRRTSVDELPQIINILLGDMSWIGPRPLPIKYDQRMSNLQKMRWGVKPGITGWAQINGRHSIDWQTKFQLDLWYVENVTFKNDAMIFFKTILILMFLKEDKSLLENEFKGD